MTVTLRELHFEDVRDAQPGRWERTLLRLTCVLLILAVAFVAAAFTEPRLAWVALFSAFVAAGTAESWLMRRSIRLDQGHRVCLNDPDAIRLALYVLQSPFEEVGVVLDDGSLVEVWTDAFALNRAERDSSMDARLADARVEYTRVDDNTAHLRRVFGEVTR